MIRMYDPKETLRLFLGADPQWISDELSALRENADSIDGYLTEYRSIPVNARTPKEDAKALHYRLLQSHIFASSPGLHQDEVLYFVCLVASQVAEDAVMVEHQSARTLNAIMDQIEDIRRGEGMDDDEVWPLGDGPNDYRRLSKDYDALAEKIHETVFLHVLQLYGFTEYAELFENERMEYEVRYEAGRRFVLPPPKCTQESKRWSEKVLTDGYGPAAVARLDQRLQAIRLFKSEH